MEEGEESLNLRVTQRLQKRCEAGLRLTDEGMTAGAAMATLTWNRLFRASV